MLSKSSQGKKRTLTHSSPQGCAQKPREHKEKRILSSPSVVAKGTRSASLCCDWIIILLLIHVVYGFLCGLFSEKQGAVCHPAGPDKSYESFPKELWRTSTGERFLPNPGRCHCHRMRWPITHGTVLTERKLLSAGLFHSEAVAHQRRSTSGG